MFFYSEIKRPDVARIPGILYPQILLVLLSTFSILSAQVMQIRDIDLYLENEVVVTRLHFMDFFTEDVKDNIASGMSRRFSVKFELVGTEKVSLFEKTSDVTLKYDIWERIYIISSGETERQFDQLEHFIKFCSDSTTFRLNSIRRIDPDKKMQLYIFFSQQEISERQQSDLKLWISRDAETTESQPGMETDQGFSINISRLLSLFFTRERSADLYVYKSPFFTLTDLRQNENAAK